MKYVLIRGQFDRALNLVYAYEDASGSIRLRERYTAMQCPECGRLDYLAALTSGIDANVTVRAEKDLCFTWDGVICLSHRLDELLRQSGVENYQTFAIPGDERYVAAWVDKTAEVDLEVAEFQFHGKQCSTCRCVRETTRNVFSVEGIAFPKEELSLFVPSIRLYGSKWPKMDLLATLKLSELVRSKFHDSGFFGRLLEK